MASNVHLDDLFLAFQSRFFIAFLIVALILFAAVYGARSSASPSIPLYVPATSAAGDRKRRWKFDSVNLLQEAYKKVMRWEVMYLFCIYDVDHLHIVLREAFQSLDHRRDSSGHSSRLCE